jgi:hypothetical protein
MTISKAVRRVAIANLWGPLFAKKLLLVATVLTANCLTAAPVSAKDICSLKHNNLNGCFEIRLARTYMGRGLPEKAAQEYIQAGRVGKLGVANLALEELTKLAEPRPPRHDNFELDLARIYGKLGAWKEAEKHFAAAGKESSFEDKQTALAGVANVRNQPLFELNLAKKYLKEGAWKDAETHFSAAANQRADNTTYKAAMGGITAARKENAFELSLAGYYFDEGAWKEAEQHYLAAIGEKPDKNTRKLAKDGVEKARRSAGLGIWLAGPAERLGNWNEMYDHLAGSVPRAVGLFLLAYLIYKGMTSYFKINVELFAVSKGSEAERLLFAFRRARDTLRSIKQPPANMQPMADRAPLFFIEGLDENFMPETMDLGDAKIPLKILLRPLHRPKVKVSGNWRVGDPLGMAQAVIERRRRLGYSESLRTHVAVPASPGDLADRRLKQFAHKVLVEAWAAA